MKNRKKPDFFSRFNNMGIRTFWIYSVIIFVAVSMLFSYRTFWVDLNPQSHNVEYLGEIQASEWGLEKIYQNIMQGESPFSPIYDTLYPFGLDVVGGDMGTAFYFPLLRPFFSTHQSFIFLIVVGPILANIGMLALLLRLRIHRAVAIILAVAYGHMTFLIPRIGHPTFISSIFLIPWFYLMLIIFFQSERYVIKFYASLAASFLLVFTLWQHMYYFIILTLSLLFMGGYWTLFRFKEAFEALRRYWLLGMVNCVFVALLLLPWLDALYKTLLLSEPSRSGGWNGAIDFSSDIVNFFIPNIHNYYYGDALFAALPFSRDIFENFTYPGIIIIGTYALYIYLHKNVPLKIRKTISPYFWTSIGFLILTLGPFLHVLDRWWIEVDEGIRLVLPLPFAILHYIPFLGNIRAPGRLIVGFIFFAYIASGFVLTQYLRDKTPRLKIIVLLLLFFIFIVDHRPTQLQTKAQVPVMPQRIFEYIRKDESGSSVLQIPFAVRDGLSYFGDLDTVSLTFAQPYFDKASLGGYSGRIPEYVKAYYQNDPFLGYLGRVIDAKINTNLSYDKSNLDQLYSNPDIAGSVRTIDFLGIKHIIVNEKFIRLSAQKKNPQVKRVTELLEQTGYVKKMTDGDYSLWERPLEEEEFHDTLVGSQGDNLLLGFGWYPHEEGFRWVTRRSSMMFKLNKARPMTLHLRAASFHRANSATIYLNKEPVAEVTLTPDMKEYKVKLNESFKKGINFVYFIFDKKYTPSQVTKDNLDARQLSAMFTKLYITEQ